MRADVIALKPAVLTLHLQEWTQRQQRQQEGQRRQQQDHYGCKQPPCMRASLFTSTICTSIVDQSIAHRVLQVAAVMVASAGAVWMNHHPFGPTMLPYTAHHDTQRRKAASDTAVLPYQAHCIIQALSPCCVVDLTTAGEHYYRTRSIGSVAKAAT